ncbi:unnamed protein product [Echinostoma caproni]|uniref:EF-hand domain-containing protein n=1 Tax=Echinostoma caproni TaxID=27848 RepID=A0A3P8GUY7_9TREM|nr:unnamed protein product [Echinostoma caproni]
MFDTDRDQKINFYEFKVALRALGFELKKQEVIQTLEEYNIKEDSGFLGFDEFNEIEAILVHLVNQQLVNHLHKDVVLNAENSLECGICLISEFAGSVAIFVTGATIFASFV